MKCRDMKKCYQLTNTSKHPDELNFLLFLRNVVESKVIGVVKENTKIVIKRKREDGEIVPTKRVKPEKPTLTDILPKVSNAKPEMRKRNENHAKTSFTPKLVPME